MSNPTPTPNVASIDSARKPAPGRSVRKPRSPWPMRVLILLVVGAGIALLARNSKKPPLVVEVVKAERAPVRDEISSASAGEVMAERDATMRSELSSRVVDIRHKRGERVKKGEVMVVLDTGDLDARVKQAVATLDAHRAQAAQADAHAEAAARTSERVKRLAEHGAETSSAADDANAQARETQAAAKAAHAQLEQDDAAIQVARVARLHADLTAPFDGLVSEVSVNLGDAVQPGTTVFEVIDDSRLHVEATLDESDISRVKVGQVASLRLDALPKQAVEGTVVKLDPTVRKDDKGARTLRIEVEVSDLPHAVQAGLRPGMSANVDVRVAEKPNVLSLPTSVIVGRGTKRSVYVVDSGVARERPVQTGMSSWERTELTAGVIEGDEVITNLNVKGLADGVPVTTSGAATP